MIVYWDRHKKREEVEQVYGEGWLEWAYGTSLGQRWVDLVLSKRKFSQLYGAYQSSKLSAHKVDPFISRFEIPMEEFEPGPYRTFNSFFIRKFKEGARSFVQAPDEMPAFAEARYFAYEKMEPNQKAVVKGVSLSPSRILGNLKWADAFAGGPVLLARLCPTDYHRFHFPDSGKVLSSYARHGKLHSVNPLALKYNGEIFLQNERQISILETDHFGKLAYIEVGALCVGKIVQTYPPLNSETGRFTRGQEKGYFLFGGSTVIVLGEPGAWKPDEDLLEQTALGRETLVRLGERVASTKRSAIG